jgi:hypothetical protein
MSRAPELMNSVIYYFGGISELSAVREEADERWTVATANESSEGSLFDEENLKVGGPLRRPTVSRTPS